MIEPAIRAVSDLHVSFAKNRELVDRIAPHHPEDWLIVAGDIGERLIDIAWVLKTLRDRFATVIWTPGNHELWTGRTPEDSAAGVARYEQLIALGRRLDVVTPEDPYPVWDGPGGPVRVAPMFLLYDYTWLMPGTTTSEESRKAAYASRIICNDERFMRTDPYPSVVEWCNDRVTATRARLERFDGGPPFVLVNHWPLHREPTRVMRYQEFPQWCGTQQTADWHHRFQVAAMVHGHLHIPRPVLIDDVPFIDVSIGYPREWERFGLRSDLARQVVPWADH